MKYLLFLVLSAAYACADIMAPTQNYNVSSPVSNGPYVVNQILPCTYKLFDNVDTSELDLQILLQNASANSLTNATVIANKADVGKTAEFMKRDGNLTYYEHAINYQIPSAVTPGQYNIIFHDLTTNTRLTIPVEIRPAAPPTPTPSLSSSPLGSTSSSGSLHPNGAVPSGLPLSFFLLVLGSLTTSFAWTHVM